MEPAEAGVGETGPTCRYVEPSGSEGGGEIGEMYCRAVALRGQVEGYGSSATVVKIDIPELYSLEVAGGRVVSSIDRKLYNE